jgi:hypothetical protein
MSILHQLQCHRTNGARRAVDFDVHPLARGADGAAAAGVVRCSRDVKVVVVGFGGHSQSFARGVVIGRVVIACQAACRQHVLGTGLQQLRVALQITNAVATLEKTAIQLDDGCSRDAQQHDHYHQLDEREATLGKGGRLHSYGACVTET